MDIIVIFSKNFHQYEKDFGLYHFCKSSFETFFKTDLDIVAPSNEECLTNFLDLWYYIQYFINGENIWNKIKHNSLWLVWIVLGPLFT